MHSAAVKKRNLSKFRSLFELKIALNAFHRLQTTVCKPSKHPSLFFIFKFQRLKIKYACVLSNKLDFLLKVNDNGSHFQKQVGTENKYDRRQAHHDSYFR